MEEQQKQECAICEPKTVHFDRTRRLSKMIRDDSFDDMLESHISGHYLNIDEKRHLRISEDFSENTFDGIDVATAGVAAAGIIGGAAVMDALSEPVFDEEIV